MADINLEMIAECLRDYANLLGDGEIDGAGRYMPDDIDEQADEVSVLAALPGEPVAVVPITTGMPELRVSLIARSVRQSLRNYGYKVADSTLPECVAGDVDRTLAEHEKVWPGRTAELEAEVKRLEATDGLAVLNKAIEELELVASEDQPNKMQEDQERHKYFGMGVNCALDTLKIYQARAKHAALKGEAP